MPERGSVVGFDRFVSAYKQKYGHDPLSFTRQEGLVLQGVVPTRTELSMYLALGQYGQGEYASVTFSIPRPSQADTFAQVQKLRERYQSSEVADTSRRRSTRQVVIWGSPLEDTDTTYVLRAALSGKKRIRSIYLGSMSSHDLPVPVSPEPQPCEQP